MIDDGKLPEDLVGANGLEDRIIAADFHFAVTNDIHLVGRIADGEDALTGGLPTDILNMAKDRE